MKIFWSWQSDIDGNISRHFIKDCLKKAIEELQDEAIFDDRAEIDHDTKDVPGSPPITDTILEKIKNCTVFVADVTPIATVESNKKKIMNPNVAIETGYAMALVGNSSIVTIMNESFGALEDLPFDLKYKRGPITYVLSETSTKDEIKLQEKELVSKLKIALKNYAKGVVDIVSPSLSSDTYGFGIFFDPSKAILRLPADGWDGVKDTEYFFKKTNSYIYTKITPVKSLNLNKSQIKKAMFDGGNFRIFPLLSSPDRSADVNKYGCIIIKFDREKDTKHVTDFVQVLESGAVISISTSHLMYSSNRIYLVSLRDGIAKSLEAGVSLLKSVTQENLDIEVEIGVVNGDNLTISLPNPDGNRYYPQPVRGPLENEAYVLKKRFKLNQEGKTEELIKDFILLMLNDLGVDFNYEEHVWQ